MKFFLNHKLFLFIFIVMYTILTTNVEYAASQGGNELSSELQTNVTNVIKNKCALCHSSEPTISSYAFIPGIKETVEEKFKKVRRLDLYTDFVVAVEKGQPVDTVILAKLTQVVEKNAMPPKSFVSLYGEIALTPEEKNNILEWLANIKQSAQGNNP